jgi:hypothetical protein
MGGYIKDSTTLDLLAQWNHRFSAGPAMDEMIALQREFQIFSPTHSLQSSWELIGIHPLDAVERRRWRRWLNDLRAYPSDRTNVSGDQRIIAAYLENFQDPTPLPIFTQCHAAQVDPRVLVTRGTPIVFSTDLHLIISLPTIPVAQVASGRAGGGQAGGGQAGGGQAGGEPDDEDPADSGSP